MPYIKFFLTLPCVPKGGYIELIKNNTIMKRLLSFLVVILISITAFAQSVTLTFTAKDAANQHVQLHRVSITNLTKGWQETIYWPDTTLTMQNGTGISDIVGGRLKSDFGSASFFFIIRGVFL